jgi:hypothetical protein
MAQTINSVFDRLIAFECIDPNTQRVGGGTAFWAEVKGMVKLAVVCA